MKPKAAIFDLDGVITETAKIHAEAWKEVFDKFLKEYYEKYNKKFIPFEEDDYLKYVDGKPRYKGVRDFLTSRDMKIPYGSQKDFSEKTICGIGNKKSKIFEEKIKKQKPHIYKTTISLIKRLRKAKIRVGVISSSKHCRLILEKCNIKNLFEVMVDGKISEEKKLTGKPNPDIFLYAAKKLNTFPGKCIIFEDSIAGVEAGVKGNFGMVVGIARKDRKNFILRRADKVVKDLKEISLKDIRNWFEKGIEKDGWKLKYHDYSPEEEKLREVLCAIGNGYIGIRGCLETQEDSESHYPGCYVAGIYNELKTKIKGKEARNNSLVNIPNWLLIKIKIGNSEFINPFEMKILEYEKILDIRKAILYHKIVFEDNKERITEIRSKRIASMHNKNLCAMNFFIRPINYSEKIIVQSLIDGNVSNNNVERYRGLKNKHLRILSKEKVEKNIFLQTETNTSQYKIAMLMKHNFKTKHKRKLIKKEKLVGEKIIFNAKKGNSYQIEKIVSICTSRDSKDPKKESLSLIKKIKNFNSEYKKHKSAWKRLWDRADIYIRGDRFSQRILRLYIYHLFSTYSPHVKHLDVGIPVRGLNGEAYRGHIFWDELYILPFFIHCFPEIARAALMYRYNRLDSAKKSAQEAGYKGAMYPWQSANTGKEETQIIHYNPPDKTWGPDLSMYQRHVSIAIFYNFYKYIKHTNDMEFFQEYAAPVMIEIARFWASIAKYNKRTRKYHIKGVMGPDEFHEKYPKSKNPGLKDNAYTNIMTTWLMKKALEIVKELPKDMNEKMNITKEELERWEDISKKINVVINNGIIMQFKGFDKLKEIDWNKYKKKYGDIRRMDRILKAEGKSPNNYKVIKQADTLLIFYLLEIDEVIKLLRELGVKINNPSKFVKKNYNYYILKTSHGSTLSRFVHNTISVKLKSRKKQVWDWFYKALDSEVNKGLIEYTYEGIHVGLIAGTVDIVRKYFAGVKTHERGISIKPWFPEHWKKLLFKIIHQKKWNIFDYRPEKESLKVKVNDRVEKTYKDCLIPFSFE